VIDAEKLAVPTSASFVVPTHVPVNKGADGAIDEL